MSHSSLHSSIAALAEASTNDTICSSDPIPYGGGLIFAPKRLQNTHIKFNIPVFVQQLPPSALSRFVHAFLNGASHNRPEDTHVDGNITNESSKEKRMVLFQECIGAARSEAIFHKSVVILHFWLNDCIRIQKNDQRQKKEAEVMELLSTYIKDAHYDRNEGRAKGRLLSVLWGFQAAKNFTLMKEVMLNDKSINKLRGVMWDHIKPSKVLGISINKSAAASDEASTDSDEAVHASCENKDNESMDESNSNEDKESISNRVHESDIARQTVKEAKRQRKYKTTTVSSKRHRKQTTEPEDMELESPQHAQRSVSAESGSSSSDPDWPVETLSPETAVASFDGHNSDDSLPVTKTAGSAFSPTSDLVDDSRFVDFVAEKYGIARNDMNRSLSASMLDFIERESAGSLTIFKSVLRLSDNIRARYPHLPVDCIYAYCLHEHDLLGSPKIDFAAAANRRWADLFSQGSSFATPSISNTRDLESPSPPPNADVPSMSPLDSVSRSCSYSFLC